MGSGKSSVGKLLAEKLKKNFIDSDQFIENQQKCSISDIFNDSERGEKYFRQLESQFILEVNHKKNLVLSTGGGIILIKNNRENLKKLGKNIYLKSSSEVIFKRLQNQSSQRPLLNNEHAQKEKQSQELFNKIKRILAKRETIYSNQADLIIDTNKLTVSEVVIKIIESI